MKSKMGHKRNQSESHGQSQDRWKRHSYHSGSDDMVQSLEEPVAPKAAKPSTSATPASAGPKASGAGSTYSRRIVSANAIPSENRQPEDGKVLNSALSVETLDGQIVYEGTPAEPLIKYETCLAELKQKGWNMRLWTVDLLEQ